MKNNIIAIFVAIIILIVGGTAFYFGQKSTVQKQGIAITPTPTTFVTKESTPTPTPNSSKTVSAGGVLVFNAYSAQVPSEWDVNHQTGTDLDKVTLTKGQYKISIYQAAFGGGGCIYPGDAPTQFAQSFSTFVEINDPNGFVFRRSAVQKTDTAFTVCQKNTTDGSFGAPTSFGEISVSAPSPIDSSTMSEIDSIIASLKKQI